MTTGTTAAGTGKAANASSGNTAAGGKDGRIEKLTRAKDKLQAAIDSTNDNEAQGLLHESISLISDACVMTHGFGAVRRHGR